MNRLALLCSLTLLLQAPAWASRSLNGSTQYFQTASASSVLITASAGTICTFVQPTGTADDETIVYQIALIAGDIDGYFALTAGKLSGGTDTFHVYNYDGTNDNVAPTAALTRNAWQHVCWRHGSGNLDLLLNGVQVATVASGNTSVLGANFTVGRDDGGHIRFSGLLAHMHTFNVALSDAAILTLCQSPTSPPANNTGYWAFTTNTAGDESDLSGNGRTLIQTGSPPYSSDNPTVCGGAGPRVMRKVKPP